MQFFSKMMPSGRAQARQELLERQRFRQELADARLKLELAQNHLDQVTDPVLIDCCIYRLNAAQLHYQVLLKQARRDSVRSRGSVL